VQGAAAAGAVPAALSLASRAFPAEPWRSRVYSVIAMAAWLAAVVGAVLGGVITSTWGWRWVFLVTVPVAALAALGTARVRVPETSVTGGATLDVRGAGLVCAGLAALLVGVDRLGQQAWLQGVLVLAASAALLGAFVATERRSASPLVPRALLASSRLVGACLAFGAYCAGYVAVVVVTSLLLQERYGLSAAGAGSLLVPMLVTGTVSALVAPRLVRRLGARRVTVAALTTCATAMAGLALSRPDGTLLLVPWLVLWGLGSGPVFVGLTREVLGDAAPDDSGAAAAVFESMSHVGGGVAASAYLTLLAVGAGFGTVQLLAAAAVATGAVLGAVVMPSTRRRAAGGQDAERPARRRAA
jgi:predicted MFS family arabinose efflux permease